MDDEPSHVLDFTMSKISSFTSSTEAMSGPEISGKWIEISWGYHGVITGFFFRKVGENTYLVGGEPTPLKNDGVRQMGV